MIPDLVIVCLLLSPDTSLSSLSDTVSPELYAQMVRASDLLEISERGNYWRPSFRDEMLWVRMHLDDSERLPRIACKDTCSSLKHIESCMDFNRERRNWLTRDRVYHPERSEVIDKQLEDIDNRYMKWSTVWRTRKEVDCVEPCNYMIQRRRYLQDLINLSNNLPCPVDVDYYKSK